jgi:hypothetical protein
METLSGAPPTKARDSAMLQRRGVKPPNKFQDRLAAFAENKRKEASSMLPGPDRNNLLTRANRADDAARVDDWAGSLFSHPGPQ